MSGDERLALRVGDGDERAFAAIYDRYHQRLYRYCRPLVGNDADAQDALQSAFTSALVALRRGQRDAPLRPWLYRIVHNEAMSVLRRRRPQEKLSEDVEVASASAEAEALGRERLSTLVADLRELPERQRGALVMRELSGLSHEEIAVALQISTGAAKQVIYEARRSLQDLEEGRAMRCEEVTRMISDGDGRALRGKRVRAHLRSCAACSAFAEAIPARRAGLNALAPPLAPALAARVLASTLGGAGSGHAGAAAGVAGQSAGLAVAGKAVVGAVLLAGAGAGLSTAVSHHRSEPPAAPIHAHARSTVAPRAAHARAVAAPVHPSAHHPAHARTPARVRAVTVTGPAQSVLALEAPGHSGEAPQPRSGQGAANGHARSHERAGGRSQTRAHAKGEKVSHASHGAPATDGSSPESASHRAEPKKPEQPPAQATTPVLPEATTGSKRAAEKPVAETP